jgi:hypothetical protein
MSVKAAEGTQSLATGHVTLTENSNCKLLMIIKQNSNICFTKLKPITRHLGQNFPLDSRQTLTDVGDKIDINACKGIYWKTTKLNVINNI